jgi:hypothetical protein
MERIMAARQNSKSTTVERTADGLTLDAATALRASTDRDLATDYVAAAVAFNVEAERTGERASVTLALATFAAAEAGLLALGKSDAEGATWTLESFGEMIGKSKARVTTLRNAGCAFVRHGIDPEGATGKAMLNRWGQSAPVAAVLWDAEENGTPIIATEAAIADAVKVAQDKAEVSKAAAAAKRTEAAHAVKEAASLVSPRSNSARLDALETLLAGFGALTVAEAKRLDGLVERITALLDAPMVDQDGNVLGADVDAA